MQLQLGETPLQGPAREAGGHPCCGGQGAARPAGAEGRGHSGACRSSERAGLSLCPSPCQQLPDAVLGVRARGQELPTTLHPTPRQASVAPATPRLTGVGPSDNSRLASQVSGAVPGLPGPSPLDPEEQGQPQRGHTPARVAADAGQLHGRGGLGHRGHSRHRPRPGSSPSCTALHSWGTPGSLAPGSQHAGEGVYTHVGRSQGLGVQHHHPMLRQSWVYAFKTVRQKFLHLPQDYWWEQQTCRQGSALQINKLIIL